MGDVDKPRDVKENKLLARRRGLGSQQRPLFVECAQNRNSRETASTASSSPTGDTYPTFDGYDTLVPLGSGFFAKVYLAKRQSDGKEVALKHVCGLENLEWAIAATRKEFQALQSFLHPHIIQAFDLFEANGSVCLALEYFEGVTLTKAAKEQPMPECVAMKLFQMLAGAVQTLHESRVVHRDIKADNIMVSRDFADLRLMDFNTAKRLVEGGALTMTAISPFQPPEVQLGFEPPSELSDIWSLGECFYFMLTGKMPRYVKKPSASAASHYDFVASTQLQLHSRFWEGMSESCKRVLRHCLSIDKTKRAGLAQLLEKEWPSLPGPAERTMTSTPGPAERTMTSSSTEPLTECQHPWARGATC